MSIHETTECFSGQQKLFAAAQQFVSPFESPTLENNRAGIYPNEVGDNSYAQAIMDLPYLSASLSLRKLCGPARPQQIRTHES